MAAAGKEAVWEECSPVEGSQMLWEKKSSISFFCY